MTGCQLGYYTHLGKGQMQLLSKREPILSVLEKSTTPPALQARLHLTQELLTFAEKQLLLPIDGQYSHYVELDRRYALWSLSAAPELSFTPYQWCYPILGCANYRGFFNHKRGEVAEHALQQQGYETQLRGVSAFSTLGWFADPVLSSFTPYPNDDYIELIFHELAHAQLYIANDTQFNESFATFVGRQGLLQFKGQLKPNEVNRNQQPQQTAMQIQVKKFKKLVKKYKEKLDQVYNAQDSDQVKRQAKTKIYLALAQDYNREKKSWAYPTAYDYWIKSVNNAALMVISDYESQVPKFATLFKDCHQDWACFYQAAQRLAMSLKKADVSH